MKQTSFNKIMGRLAKYAGLYENLRSGKKLSAAEKQDMKQTPIVEKIYALILYYVFIVGIITTIQTGYDIYYRIKYKE